MKLRIKGDSLRLRVSPSDMARLMEAGRVEETIHFGIAEEARLTYALQHAPDVHALATRYEKGQVAVLLPTERARAWAEGADVGVYGAVSVAGGQLEIAVEKDWACLDKSDADNQDTFPNPGKVC